jgi:hypothetical protein
MAISKSFIKEEEEHIRRILPLLLKKMHSLGVRLYYFNRNLSYS